MHAYIHCVSYSYYIVLKTIKMCNLSNTQMNTYIHTHSSIQYIHTHHAVSNSEISGVQFNIFIHTYIHTYIYIHTYYIVIRRLFQHMGLSLTCTS